MNKQKEKQKSFRPNVIQHGKANYPTTILCISNSGSPFTKHRLNIRQKQ